jgi:hypothetical protein
MRPPVTPRSFFIRLRHRVERCGFEFAQHEPKGIAGTQGRAGGREVLFPHSSSINRSAETTSCVCTRRTARSAPWFAPTKGSTFPDAAPRMTGGAQTHLGPTGGTKPSTRASDGPGCSEDRSLYQGLSGFSRSQPIRKGPSASWGTERRWEE